ncbi:MAG: carboxypeptidase regulatory-like domain-containing protein [Acidobacteria bacterium]|nr:carboxypeptidase regulatory-like domain-containing protein [Acidobacteriota bacterium]
MSNTRILRKLIIIVGITIAALPTYAQGQSGGVRGTILDSDGKPLKGGFAVVSRKDPAGARGGGGRKTSLATGNDGVFSIAGLPAGAYTLCIQAPGTDLLDPCRWGSAPAVNVTASQVAAAGNIRLAMGARLRVRLQDQQGQLDAHEGITKGAHVLVGVWTADGLFQRATSSARGKAFREYSLLIPRGTPLRLNVYSKYFQIQDGADKPQPLSGFMSAIQAPAQGQMNPVEYRVVAPK